MEIKPHNQSTTTPRKRIILVIAAGVFLYSGYVTESIYGYLIGVLFLATAGFSKVTTVNDLGIRMDYIAFMMKYSERWDFADISTLHHEKLRNDKQALHFAKGPMSKQLIFTPEEARQIIAKAQATNPKTYIGPVD